MSNNFFIAFLISLSVHGALLIAPGKQIYHAPITTDVIKARTSIDVSLVKTMPQVTSRPMIPETPKPRKEKPAIKKEEKQQKKEIPEHKTRSAPKPRPANIGAITEEISSLLTNKPPVYPNLARIRGWEGELLLLADIDENGKVKNISILLSSGHNTLDTAAIRSVKTWSFQNAFSMQVKIPVKFVIKD